MTAAVSGPGPYSRRPNAGGQAVRDLPQAKYGENRDYLQQQMGAPLAKDTGAPPAGLAAAAAAATPAATSQPPPAAGGQTTPAIPLLAPTNRPSEPITSGVSIGDGPGPEAAGLAAPQPASLTAALRPYMTADTTGVLAALAQHLSERGM